MSERILGQIVLAVFDHDAADQIALDVDRVLNVSSGRPISSRTPIVSGGLPAAGMGVDMPAIDANGTPGSGGEGSAYRDSDTQIDVRANSWRTSPSDEMLFEGKRLRRRRAPQYPSIETAATIVAHGAAFVDRW